MKTGHLLILLFLAAVWGGSFLCLRVSAPQFGPMALIELRVGLGALFLLPLVWNRSTVTGIRRHWKDLLIVGLLNSAVPFLLYAYALLSMTAGLAAILNSTTPLFGALVAWAWLRERLPARRAVGIFIGLAGVVALVWNQASFKPGGSGLAVISAGSATFLYGFSANYIKKRLAGVGAPLIAVGSLGVAALILLPPAIWYWPASPPTPAAWWGVFGLAVPCTSVAYVLYFRLIDQIGPTRTIAVTFLIPLFGVIWGAWLLGESISANMIWGGGVILLGTALTTGVLETRSIPLAR